MYPLCSLPSARSSSHSSESEVACQFSDKNVTVCSMNVSSWRAFLLSVLTTSRHAALCLMPLPVFKGWNACTSHSSVFSCWSGLTCMCVKLTCPFLLERASRHAFHNLLLFFVYRCKAKSMSLSHDHLFGTVAGANHIQKEALSPADS